DQTGSAQKTRRHEREDRLPRQVARLLAAHNRQGPVRLKRHASRKLRSQSRAEENRKTCRSYRMGNDTANGERLLQFAYERDCFPGRNFATTLLRSESR